MTIEIWHRNIGSISASGVILGQTAYIQPMDVFNLIKVRTDLSPDKKVISGYYIEEVRLYKIDYAERTITYKDEKYPIKNDEIIVTETGTYLRCDVFEKVFQLKCTYYFSGLSVEVTSGEPLPAESEAAAAKNRAHMQQLTGDITPDRRIPFTRTLFSMGTIDYQGGGNYNPNGTFLGSQYGLIFGGQLLGGDFDASVTGTRGEPVALKKVPWQWRTGIENSDLISQIIVGKKATFSTLTLASEQIGIQVTNAQTGYKSSFANYTISDRTEPNWTVELYINDVLINYTKADQTGYYKFVIPLSYGSTNVVLKFHGPYGEVRVQTEQLRIPYTFLPPGHVEYTATAGTSLDHPTVANSSGRADLKVGISTFMTGGGGLLYQHDAIGKAQYFPYGTSSLHLTSGILLGGEYYYKAGYRSSLNISGPAGMALDMSLDHPFAGGSKELSGISITDQRKLLLTTPLPFVKGAFRLTGLDMPINKDSGNIALSAQTMVSFFGASLDVSADYALLRDKFKFHSTGTDITGSMGLSLMLFSGTMVHPSMNLDYTTRHVSDMQLVVSKAIGPLLTLNLTGMYSFINHDKHLQADLRMNLPFAQIGLSGSGGTGQQFTGSGTIQGSIGFDPYSGSFPISNTPEVRRGGVVVRPFLDRNNNGRRDPDEPIVKHFGFDRPQGRVVEQSDGTLLVMDLEPYKKYILNTSCDDVENIAWTAKFSSFEITPPANGYAVVEIPIVVTGQIEGYVYEDNKERGGVRIKLRRRELADSSEVHLTDDLLTYSNGEFYYMGLAPGKYRAYLDPKQMDLLHYTSTPPYIDFELANKEEGDSVDKLNFTIKGAAAPGPSASTIKAR